MSSTDLTRFSINQATTPQWTLSQAIEGYARAGIGGIGVWRDKLAAIGPAQAAREVRDAGLYVPSLCKSNSFTVREPVARKAAMDDNRRAIDEASGLAAPVLVLVVGGVDPVEKDIDAARQRLRDGLHELLPYAKAAKISLGLEPLHPMYAGDRACLNTLEQALDLCDELGDGATVVADVYHCWWDPNFIKQLRRAGAARIASFHYCDWLVPTRDILLDRGMVGDGVVNHAKIRRVLDEISYSGPFELEIFSAEDWWKRDPEDVVRIAIERCRSLVGQRPRAS
jgi:sugar phosphate isomerase/epimerase